MAVLFHSVRPIPDDRLGNDDSTLYRLEDIRVAPGVELRQIDRHHWIGIRFVSGWVYVALLEFESSCADGRDTYVTIVFTAEGTTGHLRELRHMWWGDPNHPGYLYYPSVAGIERAMSILREWFDVSDG